MIKNHIALLLILFTFLNTYGQIKKAPCDCPKTQYSGTKADTTFYLSNGKAIVLCGYKNPDIFPATFSEFVLAVCGQDTIIDFWEAVLICRLKTYKDTLFVDELKYLPTEKNLSFQLTVWTTEKIYFSKQRIIRKLLVNRQMPKYNQEEIEAVLKTFENEKYGLDDSKMELANKLFIATLSGSNKARQYFFDFETKFGTLDGAFLEDYKDLTSMLGLWDRE